MSNLQNMICFLRISRNSKNIIFIAHSQHSLGALNAPASCQGLDSHSPWSLHVERDKGDQQKSVDQVQEATIYRQPQTITACRSTTTQSRQTYLDFKPFLKAPFAFQCSQQQLCLHSLPSTVASVLPVLTLTLNSFRSAHGWLTSQTSALWCNLLSPCDEMHKTVCHSGKQTSWRNQMVLWKGEQRHCHSPFSSSKACTLLLTQAENQRLPPSPWQTLHTNPTHCLFLQHRREEASIINPSKASRSNLGVQSTWLQC